MTKQIKLPFREGFKYGGIKDASDRLIVPSCTIANEDAQEQFNSDMEFIIAHVNALDILTGLMVKVCGIDAKTADKLKTVALFKAINE